MLDTLKNKIHNFIYDEHAERRKQIKNDAIDFQRKIIVNIKCPMCNSLDVTEPQTMEGYHDDVTIKFQKPMCYICKKCGYIIMFYDFSKASEYDFETREIGNVLLKT